MKLKKQLQALVNDAPLYGVSATVMEKGVNPVLKACANELKHPKYHILQNSQGDWLLTTIALRERPEQEKTVLYAFPDAQDAKRFQGNPKLTTKVMPVTHLLFRLFALEQIDSIIFLDTPGNLERGVEVARSRLQESIEQQLQQFKQNTIIT